MRAGLISKACNCTAWTSGGADLRDDVFVGATLEGINLRDAKLDDAVRCGGDWRPGANLTGATWIDGSVCGSGSLSRCAN